MNDWGNAMGLGREKLNTKLMRICIILGILISIMLMTSLYLIDSESDSLVSNIDEVDVLIVLGAGIWGDQVSPQLALRLDTAMALISENDEMVVVVSGGQGVDEDLSEALAMKKYLVALGVDGNKILLEDQSTSTRENLVLSKFIIDELDINDPMIAIVTTNFHMYRAKMISKRIGFNAVGESAPNIASIIVKNTFREIFALIKDFIIRI